jgi:hypothetical protein
MIKKILLLKLMALCFTSSLFCGLRDVAYLKNIHNLPSIMEENGFLPSETAIIFDIDGTLVVENEPLFNQELCREQSDHLKELASILSMNEKEVWEDISYFKEKEEDCIRFVEETISETIQSLQGQDTTIFTCTRSVFGYPHDHRISFMKKNNVDFSKSYLEEHFASVPFFNPQNFGINCHDFEKMKFRGHSSAYEAKKSETIDEIVNALKKTKQIKNIIFVDNFIDEVEDVCDNCQSVDNIISLYYIRVREDTKIDELVVSYKKFEQKHYQPAEYDKELDVLLADNISDGIIKSYDDIENTRSKSSKKPLIVPKFIDFGLSSKGPILHAPQAINPSANQHSFLLTLSNFGWKVNPDEIPARPSFDLGETYPYDSEESVTDTEDSESE